MFGDVIDVDHLVETEEGVVVRLSEGLIYV